MCAPLRSALSLSVPTPTACAPASPPAAQVQGVSNTAVHTASHSRSLLATAQQTRAQGVAGAAEGTHLVVLLTVRSANTETGESAVGKLTLVDLASSDQAGAEKPSADAPPSSLGALNDVVTLLSNGSKKVPFESSKLTRLLTDPLGGSCKTMLLVTISPTLPHVSESAAALAFAQKARAISLGPASKIKGACRPR